MPGLLIEMECPGWPRTMILLISPSWAAWVTGTSHCSNSELNIYILRFDKRWQIHNLNSFFKKLENKGWKNDSSSRAPA
jgi:hypothetical protein